MKLGVFTVLFGDRPFEAALDRIAAAGVDCVEIGTGNYPGETHCHPEELLADTSALRIFQHTIASRGLEISALSCHGNPIHPQADVARANHETVLRQPVQRLSG
jgi:sugar phosphate isomerase/epimerase